MNESLFPHYISAFEVKNQDAQFFSWKKAGLLNILDTNNFTYPQ